jgi:TPR repeat protein
MKHLLRGIVLAAALVSSDFVQAGPFEDGVAAHGRGDFATALDFFGPLAALGHAGAQIRLVSMYVSGQGVPKDYAEALKWYRRAAEQVSVPARCPSSPCAARKSSLATTPGTAST